MPQPEYVRRFNRLIREVRAGSTNRNAFAVWELDWLLDYSSCFLRERMRNHVLNRYQSFVRAEFAAGATRPLKLSEFLSRTAPGE